MGERDISKTGGRKIRAELMKPLPHSEVEWDVTPISGGRRRGPRGEKQFASYVLTGSVPKRTKTA